MTTGREGKRARIKRLLDRLAQMLREPGVRPAKEAFEAIRTEEKEKGNAH